MEEYIKVKWQEGTVAEAGLNGVQVPQVLQFVLDQLVIYQNQFPCKENAVAITKIEEAIMWQEKRTRDRIKRGVEGKHEL